jgi:central kinetochore subunit Mis15/CHL4
MHDDKENDTHSHDDASKSARPATNKRPSGSGTVTTTERALSPDSKKRRLAVESRFGTVGCSITPAPLDRLDIRLLDSLGANDDDDPDPDRNAANLAPAVSVTFTGSDVIGGIRKLAELGVVDPEHMPSWMTGEEAVSTAFVREGKRLHVER